MQFNILRQIERNRRSFESEDSDSDLNSDTDEEHPDSFKPPKEKKEDKSKPTSEVWKSEAKRVHPPECLLLSFLSREARQCSSPLEFFRVFVTLELMDQIVKATNSYGSNKFKKSWIDTDRKEMDIFFSAVIYMGIHRSPTLKSYWAEDSKPPFIIHLFPSRDRFLQLYRSFYIAEGERDLTDPIWHVRPLVDSFTKSFPLHHSPSHILVFDESMVFCKARSTLKQYIKDKPHRWGYKIWCLVSDGYLQQFSVYLGKKGRQKGETPSEAVILLVTPYYGMNHVVVMNNFFCSPSLCQTLLRNSTFVLGTIQSNRRGFPSSLVEESSNLSRGQWSFRQNEKMVAYVFVDRKPVYFLSTYYYPSQLDTLERHGKKGQKLLFEVPKAVTAYNSFRSGVDIMDQLQSYYSIGRKNRRWWPRLAWWLIDMCILNAHRLNEIKKNEKMSVREFREDLMHELAGDIFCKSKHQHIIRKEVRSQYSFNHHLVITEDKRDCSICSSRPDQRKTTKFQCKICNVFLCPDTCYDIHINSNDV